LRFFALRMTVEPKIPGAIIPRRVFTQPGSFATGPPRFPAAGVVIGVKGDVLTNAHVVEGCQKITVKAAFGNPETAALVARDERNDLAVIRLAGPVSSVAVFRGGVPVRAGDAIVALGYPLSGVLATTANVSVGNVSALAGLADDSRYPCSRAIAVDRFWTQVAIWWVLLLPNLTPCVLPGACEHRDQTSNRIKRNGSPTSDLFKPPLYSLSRRSGNIQMR
jgi:hypothetical protein